jgi:hypothetical protein
MSRFDTAALRQGGAVALVFAVPFSVASRLVSDQPGNSPWTAVLWLAALLGFGLGAGIAAWTQTKRLPFLHGMVCAGGTFLAAQGVFIVIKLARGGTVHWLSVFFTFTTVLFVGIIGGGLGSALQARGITPGFRNGAGSTRQGDEG